MNQINWINAYNRLFELINSDKGYHSGSDFLEVLQPINYSIPSYTKLINERREAGKSTSRKDYYYDFLMSLTKTERIKAFNLFIDKLKIDFPDKVEELNEIINNQPSRHPTEIPGELWNADLLTEFLEKMDKSITEKDFNRTLTLAYSCLEGLYKAYVRKNIPTKQNLIEVNPLAKEVRDHIKQKLDKENKIYPDTIFSIIGTTTNAISNARNNFSESHFNNKADEWLAEYIRDNVNATSRLVLKFI